MNLNVTDSYVPNNEVRPLLEMTKSQLDVSHIHKNLYIPPTSAKRQISPDTTFALTN